MKTLKPKKLSLSSETLRKLSSVEMSRAAGGRASASVNQDLKCAPTRPTNTCPTDGCSGVGACESAECYC